MNTQDQFDDAIFDDAINVLKDGNASARDNAIDTLCQIAVQNNVYRDRVVQEFCLHIRSFTLDSAYQRTYDDTPIPHIQKMIDVLFRGENPLCVDLSVRVDLSGAFLPGVDFNGAQCSNVIFNKDADLRGATFNYDDSTQRIANCNGANFSGADCTNAEFWRADCRGADFTDADCEGANFFGTDCRDAVFPCNTNADLKNAQR